jgi:hypothetical protein
MWAVALQAFLVICPTISKAQILLPPEPQAAPPPRETLDQFDRDLENKKNQRESRERREQRKKEKQQKILTKKEIFQEAIKPRERFMLMEIALVSPTVLTSGDREGYTSELNTHFNLLFRHNGRQSDGKRGLWYGFRMAPFTGTGIYKGVHGNYGFVYFGPMIGVGTLDAMPQDRGRDEIRKENATVPVITGWVASFGLAGQSRQNGMDDADQGKVDDEFTEKGFHFDAPGAWLELRHLRVYHGALGLNFNFGIQTGREKQFIYAGVGVGGWH